MRPRLLFLLLLLVATFPAIAQEDSYRLGPGDRIDIRVFGEEDLSLSVLIGESGVLNYPLLGELRVSERTVKELETELTQRLRGDYLVDPDVTVSVDEYRPVFVNGEVKNPGAYPFQPGLTLQKAIALAGGFTERASRKKIQVLAADGSEQDAVDAQHGDRARGRHHRGAELLLMNQMISETPDRPAANAMPMQMQMQPEVIDLRRYLNVLLRVKWRLLGTALAVTLIAGLVVFSLTPIYRATTTVLIESEEARVLSIEEVYGIDSTAKEYFLTQFEIIKSRPIAERVVTGSEAGSLRGVCAGNGGRRFPPAIPRTRMAGRGA